MRRLGLVLILALVAVLLLPPWLAGPLGWEPDPRHRPELGRSVVLADGRFLNVIEKGSGTPVILVHGLPSNASELAPLGDAIAAAGPYRVIAYDRVGYGHSTREAAAEAPYTFESNARELAALMDALGISQAVLVGWSYGGGIVMRLAADAPERASHLVLIASVGTDVDPGREHPLAERILVSPVGEWAMNWVGSIPPLADGLARQALAGAFAREEAIPDGWIEASRASLAMPGTLETWRLETRRMDRTRLHPERIDTPALVIQGADDYSVPYTTGEALHAALPNSRFEPVLSGSHMIPVTHAETLAARLHELVGAY
ncbi:MAG: alpha/beta fold hydrolase [Myxococcota bacterium]